jgi:hypothetical protein
MLPQNGIQAAVYRHPRRIKCVLAFQKLDLYSKRSIRPSQKKKSFVFWWSII